MAYTLRDLMQTETFQELQVIAGEGGLDNPVRYVGVLEAPDSVDFVKEYEFILTTGYVFTSQTDRMLEIMQKLHEHHAAAMGIKMFRYLKTLPEEAKRMADEYRLPIFFIPNKYSWHELILPLILNISAMNAEDGGLYQDYDQLIYGMQHSQTIYDFISRAGELLQKPLTMVNRITGDQLHYPADTRPALPAVEDWTLFLTDKNVRTVQNGKVRYYHPDKRQPGFLAVELSIPEYQYLVLWDSPEPTDLNLYNYLVYSLVLISDSIQNRRTAQKNQILQKSLVLQKILMENGQEEPQAAAVGVMIGTENRYVPMLVRFGGEQGHLEERITVYNPVVVRLLEQLEQKWRIHGFTDAAGGLHLLVPLEGDKTPGELLGQSRKLSAGIQKTVQGYFPDLPVQAVAGKAGTGWEGLRARHQELLNTVKLLERQKETAEWNPLIHLHDLGMSVFLSNPEIRGFLKDFLEEYFWPLEKLEPANREKMLTSVNAYVEAGFNTREAARRTGVHHNTIRNRLEEFLTLTGLELTRSQDLLIFLLYLQIMGRDLQFWL